MSHGFDSSLSFLQMNYVTFCVTLKAMKLLRLIAEKMQKREKKRIIYYDESASLGDIVRSSFLAVRCSVSAVVHGILPGHFGHVCVTT